MCSSHIHKLTFTDSVTHSQAEISIIKLCEILKIGCIAGSCRHKGTLILIELVGLAPVKRY